MTLWLAVLVATGCTHHPARATTASTAPSPTLPAPLAADCDVMEADHNRLKSSSAKFQDERTSHADYVNKILHSAGGYAKLTDGEKSLIRKRFDQLYPVLGDLRQAAQTTSQDIDRIARDSATLTPEDKKPGQSAITAYLSKIDEVEKYFRSLEQEILEPGFTAPDYSATGVLEEEYREDLNKFRGKACLCPVHPLFC